MERKTRIALIAFIPLVAFLTLDPLWTSWPDYAIRAGVSNRTSRTSRAGRTIGADGARYAGGASGTGGTGRTFRTGRTGLTDRTSGPLRSRCALRARRPSFALATSEEKKTGYTDSNQYRPHQSTSDRFVIVRIMADRFQLFAYCGCILRCSKSIDYRNKVDSAGDVRVERSAPVAGLCVLAWKRDNRVRGEKPPRTLDTQD